MRQTILIAAALVLVLSAVLFAVAPVHAQGYGECRGVYRHYSGTAPDGQLLASFARGNTGIHRGAFDPQNPSNCSFPGYY